LLMLLYFDEYYPYPLTRANRTDPTHINTDA
jgi:hypothetical protein